ncbi:hypothetical protein DVH24_012557 [Malus domestica]|uniref:Beta-amylase n=1 Tax=Malus domestica TaxID=3750 RepID=A0A498HVE7_MALDO|nr:hypothetical protein DVH24_012557 [Malus domestica]
MGRPLVFEILDKPATSCFIGICSAIWFYIQKKNIGYSHVGLSYETAVAGHHWRIITSAFSHISMKAVSKLVKNDSSVHQVTSIWFLTIFRVCGCEPTSEAGSTFHCLGIIVLSRLLKSNPLLAFLFVVMSFHDCGGNVGDDVHIPLPHWVTEIGQKNPDIYFTNKEGKHNTEFLTLGIDKGRVLRGRTAVEVWYSRIT